MTIILFVIALLGIIVWAFVGLYKDAKQTEADIEELFDLQRRISDLEFRTSVQESIRKINEK